MSIESTDPNTGSIYIQWVKPKLPDFGLLHFIQGPYRFELLRAEGIGGSEFRPHPKMPSSLFNNFSSPNMDTLFLDEGLNTINGGYTYLLNFLYRRWFKNYMETSQPASSIYLGIISSDNRTDSQLGCNPFPWQNYNYEILRKNNSGEFEVIGESTARNYVDRDAEKWCKYIVTKYEVMEHMAFKP